MTLDRATWWALKERIESLHPDMYLSVGEVIKESRRFQRVSAIYETGRVLAEVNFFTDGGGEVYVEYRRQNKTVSPEDLRNDHITHALCAAAGIIPRLAFGKRLEVCKNVQ